MHQKKGLGTLGLVNLKLCSNVNITIESMFLIQIYIVVIIPCPFPIAVL